MSSKIVDQKTELLPNGVKVTWKTVRETEHAEETIVRADGPYVYLEWLGDRFVIARAHAAHIGRLLIAVGEQADGEAPAA